MKYRMTSKWANLTISEEMEIETDMSPEEEIAYAEDIITDKWCAMFGEEFILNADETTTETVT